MTNTAPPQNTPKSAHEKSVASFVNYLSTELPKIPQQHWGQFSTECLSLTQAFINKGTVRPDVGFNPGFQSSYGNTPTSYYRGPYQGYPYQTQPYHGFDPRHNMYTQASNMGQYGYGAQAPAYTNVSSMGGNTASPNAQNLEQSQGPIFNTLTAPAALGSSAVLSETNTRQMPSSTKASTPVTTSQASDPTLMTNTDIMGFTDEFLPNL